MSLQKLNGPLLFMEPDSRALFVALDRTWRQEDRPPWSAQSQRAR